MRQPRALPRNDYRRLLPPEFSQLSTLRTIAALLFDWSVIAGAVAMATAWPNVATFLLAQVVIATRQHALFLIMHEGTHYLINRDRRLNEWLSDILAAWPVGVSTDRYRKRHQLHHRHLNSDQDPDWARKKDVGSWQFPMTPISFWKTSLPYLFGKGLIEMTYAVRALGPARGEFIKALPFYLTVAAAIHLSSGWTMFALYWLLPYFTLLPFLHRMRYSAEHLALPWTSSLNSTRNVVCSAFENFLFSPHGTSMHLVHHLYPSVPWHKLRAAHLHLCQDPEYRESAWSNTTYAFSKSQSVYAELTTTGPQIVETDTREDVRRSA